jgi:outer membrane protein TolC
MLSRRHIVVFAVVVVLAASAVPASATEVMVIKLEDAIAQALERNSQIIPAILDLELARLELQRAEADQVLSPNPTTLRQRRMAVEKAEENLAATRTTVEQEVRRQAFNILKAIDTVALNERRLEQSKNDLETTKLKVSLNMESTVSLMNAERSVISAEQTLESSITSLKVAQMNFLKYIGEEDITKPFTIEVDDFELTLETWDEEEALELALKQTARIISARETLEGAELDLALNDAGFTPATDRRRYEIALIKAKLTLEEEEKQARIQVHQYISDIASLHKDMIAAELQLKIAEEQLMATRLKYEQNMVTETQLISQETAYTQARLNLLDTKFRVRDKQQEFRSYLGL